MACCIHGRVEADGQYLSSCLHCGSKHDPGHLTQIASSRRAFASALQALFEIPFHTSNTLVCLIFLLPVTLSSALTITHSSVVNLCNRFFAPACAFAHA